MPATIPQAASKPRTLTGGLRVVAIGLALALFSACRKESVATVDRPLSADELARVGPAVLSVEAFLAERARTGGSESDAALLDRLIQRELLYAEARRVAFDQSPALQAAWKNLVIQRFQEELENQGEALPAVTAADLEAEYAQHPERYSLPAQVRAALIQLPPTTSNERVEEVRAEALRAAKETTDFGPVAACSMHPSGRRLSGDLGWLTQTQASLAFPQNVVTALFALNRPGEISPAVNTAEGVFLLKLIEARPPRLKPFEAVRDQIAYELQRNRRAAAEQLLYAKLRTHHLVQTNQPRLAGLSPASPPVAARPPRLPSR